MGMSGQLPVVWRSALGSKIISNESREYIDFTSGIFVANIGHGSSFLLDGLRELIAEESPLIYTYNYHHKYRASYLEALIKFSKPYFEKAHIMSSGTESTEAALKLMLMNASKSNKKKRKVLTIAGNYHGRTFGSAMMSGEPFYSTIFPELDEIFVKIPFPDPRVVNERNGEEYFYDSISRHGLENLAKFKEELAGAMIETFQGWACYFYPVSYIRALVKFVREANGLVCFDEMQSGFGRTGKKFGFEHYGLVPDLICIGKGMGSGVAISGILGSAKILDLPTPGTLSSTNSANPIACMAGIKTIEAIENDNLIERSFELGEYFHQELQNIKLKSSVIENIYGKGMIAAIHFKFSEDLDKNIRYVNNLAADLMNQGLLVVKTGRSSIKLGPPLSITKADLDKGLKIISGLLGQ